MRCSCCGSEAVTERPERTAQGYRRFRCRACGKQFNERRGGLLNRAQYPSDVIALVVLWRLRYALSLRDLAEMFLTRGIVFSHEAVREWEAKLTRLWLKRFVAVVTATSVEAGMSTKRISRCTANNGVTYTGPSTATVLWWM